MEDSIKGVFYDFLLFDFEPKLFWIYFNGNAPINPYSYNDSTKMYIWSLTGTEYLTNTFDAYEYNSTDGKGIGAHGTSGSSYSNYIYCCCRTRIENNTIYWFSQTYSYGSSKYLAYPERQFNSSNVSYYYFAIG